MIKVPVRHGGLMRCCLATLVAEMTERTELPAEGEKLQCKYHDGGGMIFRDGAWEWNKENEEGWRS